MKFNQVLGFRLLSLAICMSLLAACHSEAPQPSNTTPTTPPNDATAATATANGNTASPTAPVAQGGSPVNCGNCWVHIFDDKNFKATDDNHIICGPGAWPHLRNLPGAVKLNWGDEIESLRVAPGATVTVWTGEQFTGASQTFTPGTEKMTLKDLPGFSDGISSLEIKCQ